MIYEHDHIYERLDQIANRIDRLEVRIATVMKIIKETNKIYDEFPEFIRKTEIRLNELEAHVK